MRAITPEDLKLVAGQDAAVAADSSSSSTITITSPPPPQTVTITASRPPPISSIPGNPPTQPPPSVPGNPPCLPIAWRTVQTLTQSNEVSGPSDPALTSGTVPNGGAGVGAHSGVTVSYGIDLSWQYSRDLAAAGLSTATINRLRPFLAWNITLPIGENDAPLSLAGHGLQGTAAAALLGARPIDPQLTSDEVQLLFTHFYGIAEGRAEQGFVKLTDGATFLSLPAAAQSVLTDLAFNMGAMSKWPAAMQQAIAAQDWSGLADLIAQLPGTRGANDAAVLRKAIATGQLASTGNCSY
jgi:hypothetical protein